MRGDFRGKIFLEMLSASGKARVSSAASVRFALTAELPISKPRRRELVMGGGRSKVRVRKKWRSGTVLNLPRPGVSNHRGDAAAQRSAKDSYLYL